MAVRLANAVAIAACNAIVDLLDSGGSLVIRTGAQPATADDASTGTVLATFTIPAPGFGAASDGNPHANAVANAISDVTAAATGTAGHYEVTTTGPVVRWRGTVTATGGGGDLTITDINIVSGNTVGVTSWTFRHLEL